MSVAGYKSTVKINGTSTSITDMPTTALTGNKFEITDASKRTLDRNVPVIVKLGATTLASTLYTIDYLFGSVTIPSYTTGSVTIGGAYFPTSKIAGISTYTVNLSNEIQDNTDLTGAQINGGYRTKTYGLNNVSVTIDRFYDITNYFKDEILNRKQVILDISPSDSSTDILKGWFILEKDDNSGDAGSLETESLIFQLDGNIDTSFSWRKA